MLILIAVITAIAPSACGRGAYATPVVLPSASYAVVAEQTGATPSCTTFTCSTPDGTQAILNTAPIKLQASAVAASRDTPAQAGVANRARGRITVIRAGRVTRCAAGYSRLVRDDVLDATGGPQQPFIYGSLTGRQEFFSYSGECRGQAARQPQSSRRPFNSCSSLMFSRRRSTTNWRSRAFSARRSSSGSGSKCAISGAIEGAFLGNSVIGQLPLGEPEPHCGQVMIRGRSSPRRGARVACSRPCSRNPDPAGRCERVRGQRSTWRWSTAQCVRSWWRP
jgi:hypothetical protein